MNPCPMNNAFNGKPFCQDSEPLYKTYSIYDKKNNEDDKTDVDPSKVIHVYESPLMIISENTFVEGKFRERPTDNGTRYSIKCPYPYMHDKAFSDKEFVRKLKMIMNDNKKYAIPYNKSSKCVLCSKALGNLEYTLQKGNIKFIFQEGIIHYYIRHNVWPSKEFYWFIKEY